MSPEYALDGLFSIKSDVFSFGVVTLEIITGKRNTGFYEPEQALSLISYVSVIISIPIKINIPSFIYNMVIYIDSFFFFF